jgi:hypothetical protein
MPVFLLRYYIKDRNITMKFNDNDMSAIIYKAQEEKNTFIMGRTVKTQAAHLPEYLCLHLLSHITSQTRMN